MSAEPLSRAALVDLTAAAGVMLTPFRVRLARLAAAEAGMASLADWLPFRRRSPDQIRADAEADLAAAALTFMAAAEAVTALAPEPPPFGANAVRYGYPTDGD